MSETANVNNDTRASNFCNSSCESTATSQTNNEPEVLNISMLELIPFEARNLIFDEMYEDWDFEWKGRMPEIIIALRASTTPVSYSHALQYFAWRHDPLWMRPDLFKNTELNARFRHEFASVLAFNLDIW